ncbi:MAG: hypothetical protein VKJ04_09700 [Vampirovibrionales bacterium]|nr:hypothetical protein [Vampirovibrionales bacterium]
MTPSPFFVGSYFRQSVTTLHPEIRFSSSYPTLALKRTLNADQVQFSGTPVLQKDYLSLAKHELLLQPHDINLVMDDGVTLPNGVTKKILLDRWKESRLHAGKSAQLGNFSGHSYATNLMLNNGQWGLGINLELTENTTLCGERSAMTVAWNKGLEGISPKQLETTSGRNEARDSLKAKIMILTSGDPAHKAGAPCSKCLDWLSTKEWMGPDVLMVYMEDSAQAPSGLQLHISSLRSLIPHIDHVQPSKTNLPIDNLPMMPTSWEIDSIVDDQKSTELLQEAKENYTLLKAQVKRTLPEKYHEKPIDCTVALLSTGETVAGKQLRWTSTLEYLADINALHQASQPILKKGSGTKLIALAYYGDTPVPTAGSLGWIARAPWAKASDTVIIRIQETDEGIAAISKRKIKDYLNGSFNQK